MYAQHGLGTLMLEQIFVLFITEIDKFQKGESKEEEKYIDVVINKNMKLGQKVLIPVKQFPKVSSISLILNIK